MNIAFENQKNYKAITWTIVVHVILLFLFYILKMNIPTQQPIEELGMEVNLGLGEEGFGDDQHEDPNDPANELSVANNLAGSNDQDEQKNIHTTDDNDAPIVQNPNLKKSEKKPTQIVSNKQQQTTKNSNNLNNSKQQQTTAQKPKYTYANSNGTGGNRASGTRDGSNEGRGTGNGDAGVLGGTTGADNYKGTPGRGNADWPHTLEGRFIAQEPDKSAEFSKGGKVKVLVTVDRDGNIKNYSWESSASNELKNIVASKIKRVKFNKSATAPVEQKGYIYFTFKVGQ